MFFAILMLDGQLTTLPSLKIPGQAGNDEESGVVERSCFYDKLQDIP